MNEENKCRYLTINTDASFFPNEKVGGYAFYIVCDFFKIKKSGVLKNPINSGEAERQSIANALYTLVYGCEKFEVDSIILNTDFKAIIKEVKNPRDTVVLITNLIEKLKKKTKATNFEIRHVKAHSGISDARSFVNEWCDREAKNEARKLIKNT